MKFKDNCLDHKTLLSYVVSSVKSQRIHSINVEESHGYEHFKNFSKLAQKFLTSLFPLLLSDSVPNKNPEESL